MILRAAAVGIIVFLVFGTGVKAGTSASYDPAYAIDAFFWARTAYCGASGLQTWTCGVSCEKHAGFVVQSVIENATAESQAYTGYYAPTKTMVVAIRGSANLLNWLYDFDFAFVPFPDTRCAGCKVHRGFLRVWQSLSRSILADYAVIKAKFPDLQTVLVTGHSLGAATALLAALDLARIGAPVTLYNYGEPRVGDPAFAAWAVEHGLPQGVQFRVTHRNDPVPRVPPLEFGYLHAPHELWYDNEGNTTYKDCQDNATAEDMSCSAGDFVFDGKDHSFYLGHCTSCTGCASAEYQMMLDAVRDATPLLKELLTAKPGFNVPKRSSRRATLQRGGNNAHLRMP